MRPADFPAQSPSARPCVSGIGWTLQRLMPGGTVSRKLAEVELSVASIIAGLWSFLAVGALIFEKGASSTVSDGLGLLAWLPAWIMFLQALVLVPPLVLLPMSRFGFLSPARSESCLPGAAQVLLLLVACRLAASSAWPARVLGWFWVSLFLGEMLLLLFRKSLRLASKPD